MSMTIQERTKELAGTIRDAVVYLVDHESPQIRSLLADALDSVESAVPGDACVRSAGQALRGLLGGKLLPVPTTTALESYERAVAGALEAPSPAAPDVKLVIWDLDDTFWRGTLAEGDALEIPQAHLDAVRELTRRGIVNAICSKNDFAAARARLEQAGIWDQFVFPRIAFSPKGELIRDIIGQAQLRAENVLFIDDNTLNLEEARYYSPGLQVLDAAASGGLLSMPGLAGKPDGGQRLAQYKMLEQRSREREGASSNDEFLRQSDIRIRITPTREADAERVHDMVARTNQLNFTKKRVSPEDVRALVADPANQTATIAVRDRFGDHGVVGWYCLRDGVLEHFLFSCRIINLGIEQFVYAHLGHPRITVAGEVASTLSAHEAGADYIALETGSPPRIDAPPARQDLPRLRLFASGACDMYYLVGTLANALTDVTFECNTFRGNTRGVNVSTEYLRSCFDMPDDDKALCVRHFHNYSGQTAFKTQVFDGVYDYALFSFNDDAELFTYQHRSRPALRVVLSESAAYSVTPVTPPAGEDADEWLCSQFDCRGLITPERFRDNLLWMAGRMPAHTRILLMTLPEFNYFRNALPAFPQYRRQCLRLNRVIRELCATNERFTLVEMNKHVTDRSHFTDYVMHLRPERGFLIACEALQAMARRPVDIHLAAQLPVQGRTIVLLGKGIETIPYLFSLQAAGLQVSHCAVQDGGISLMGRPVPRLSALAWPSQDVFAIVTPQLGASTVDLQALGYADGANCRVLQESVFNLDWKER
ncbi:MAG: hypothetical protein QM750_17200 [Rubrivivax sp.]